MNKNVVLNKMETIEKCLRRINEKYVRNELKKNIDMQDIIVLNLQRACEASIDLAMHIIRDQRYALPQNTKDVFSILCEHKVIDEVLSKQLQSMVGFRNIAVHDYAHLNLAILESVVESHLVDFEMYMTKIKKFLNNKKAPS